MTSVCRCAFALLLIAATASAATKTWSGAVDNRWSVGGNWVGGAAPVNGDALVFQGPHTNLVNDIAGVLAVQSMTFISGQDYDLTGNAITLAGGLTATCCGTGFLTIDLPITLAAPQPFDGGNQVFYVAGPINLNGFTLTFASGVNMPGSFSGSGNVVFNNGASFAGASSAAGTITISGPAQFTGNVTTTQFTKIGSQISAVGTLGPATMQNTTLAISHAIGIPGGYAGPDVLHTGNLVLDHGTLSIRAPNEQIVTAGTVTLLSPALDLSFAPYSFPLGQPVTIIDNDGSDPVQGTFANLPEGALFTAGSTQFRISYIGGSGNDVVLTAVAAIPTLSDAALLLLAAALAAIALVTLSRG